MVNYKLTCSRKKSVCYLGSVCVCEKERLIDSQRTDMCGKNLTSTIQYFSVGTREGNRIENWAAPVTQKFK